MLDHVTTRSNSPRFALFCGCNTLLVHCLFICFVLFCWSSGWKIVRNDSQQYILVALKRNDTNFCNGWWRGNSEPNTFCIHWKNFLTNFWILHFPTQWFLAKRTMWDFVLVIWPFLTFHVMKLNMSKEFSCVFLQDFERCDERPKWVLAWQRENLCISSKSEYFEIYETQRI